jgi:uncharacterized protein (TIGR03086 family)
MGRSAATDGGVAVTDNNDIDVLEGVLIKLEGLVAGVRPDQLDDRTGCPGYDVRGMVNHIVGFLQNFAAAAQGEQADVDPTKVVSTDPVKDVRNASEQILAGWRQYGTDREVSVMGPGTPGEMVLGMTIIEYVAHGSDLAMATGQAIPFTDLELEVALDRAEASLTDDYRGEGKPFGPRIEVPEDASAAERFLGFMGRRVPVG